VLVSHRVAAVKNADQILVVDGGRIAERGTHAELLAAAGLYAALYREQLAAEALAHTAAATTPGPPARRPARHDAEDILGKALDRTLLRRIFAHVWPYKRLLLLALLFLPVASAMEIAQPYLLKKAIDEHIAKGQLAGLDRLGVLYMLALVGQYG